MSECLVEVSRGSIVESLHRGNIAIVAADGQLKWQVGDATSVTFIRSAAKPLQTLPLIESGAADYFQMTDEEIALSCASHNGETFHSSLVEAFLKRIGVPVSALRCGIHPPFHTAAYESLLRQGLDITTLQNNCSGKHAGMLALAKYLDADLEDYLNPNHPVQVAIIKSVQEVCEVSSTELHIAVDGCGVPVFGLPLNRMALAYAKYAAAVKAGDSALARIARAMMSHPDLVGGTNRFCTKLMSVTPQKIIAKTGAEGVYCVGLVEEGLGIALKVEDGNARATYPAIVECLSQMGVLNAQQISTLESFHRPELRNHQGTLVGQLTPVFHLEQVNANH